MAQVRQSQLRMIHNQYIKNMICDGDEGLVHPARETQHARREVRHTHYCQTLVPKTNVQYAKC